MKLGNALCSRSLATRRYVYWKVSFLGKRPPQDVVGQLSFVLSKGLESLLETTKPTLYCGLGPGRPWRREFQGVPGESTGSTMERPEEF
jgi:hypothetical protein